MSHPADRSHTAAIELYTSLLTSWNEQNATRFAELFAADGYCVGFDGSQMDGREAIASALGAIFADHTPAAYVAKVRTVRSLGGGQTLLIATAGMVPPGQRELKAERNAIQSLVAREGRDGAEIVLFQNTPAAFDGRPEAAAQLTRELTQVLRSGVVVDRGIT